MTPSRHRLLAALLVPALLVLGACSGGGKDQATPQQALSAAKKHLDTTSGVHISLSTGKLPNGVNGILEASGVGTHAPAFQGTLKVATGGITADAAVVAVDNAVYAKLPFTTKFAQIDPADYAAPDPAGLMDSEGGLSSLLTAMQQPKRGEQVRDGKLVLTEYTGTVPGDAVASVIPSASADGDFDATFTLTGDNRLNEAVLTGPFYPGAGDVTYTIRFSEYDTPKDITAP